MVTLKINGEYRTFEAPDDMPLLWVLRDLLEVRLRHCAMRRLHGAYRRQPGTFVPAAGRCDRQSRRHHDRGHRRYCSGRESTESLARFRSDPVRLCQSGQIMSAAALLTNTPHPDDSDIDAAMAGNISRCGTYVRIREAIKHAAGERQS